jgi:hypothetical protein
MSPVKPGAPDVCSPDTHRHMTADCSVSIIGSHGRSCGGLSCPVMGVSRSTSVTRTLLPVSYRTAFRSLKPYTIQQHFGHSTPIQSNSTSVTQTLYNPTALRSLKPYTIQQHSTLTIIIVIIIIRPI